jgi:signal transduction histidine kinase
MSSSGSPAGATAARASEMQDRGMTAETALRIAKAHMAFDVLASGRSLPTTLNELTNALRGVLASDLVAVDVPSPAGRLRAVAAAIDSPAWSQALRSVGLGSGSPPLLDVDAPQGQVPTPAEFESLGVTSLLAFPLRGRHGDGVLWLGFPAAHVMEAGELTCLQVLAAELSLRLERAMETVGPESSPADSRPVDKPHESERFAQGTEELIGMAVHEIRTPLTPLTMLLNSLERKAKNGATDIDVVSRARRQVERLTQMVSDLLDLSRLGRGRLELSDDSADIAEALRVAAQKFRDAHGEERLELHAIAGPVFVRADGHRLGTSLFSLLEHVTRVSPSSRAVTVDFEVADHHALVSIRSTAPSSPEIRAAHLPEPAKSPSHHAERLKGIAAHLAEALIRRQGGSVATDDDRGSLRLRLTFPLAPPLSAPPPSDDTPPTVAPGRGGQ